MVGSKDYVHAQMGRKGNEQPRIFRQIIRKTSRILDNFYFLQPCTLGSDVTLKNALIWEPFVRIRKFRGLIRLESYFLLFGQTVRHLPCNSGITQIIG